MPRKEVKMKKLLLLLMFASYAYGVTETCPIMKGDENDPEEFSVVAGKKIYFCCGSCVSKFDENKAYYIKAIPSLQKKFTEVELKELGVDKVKLLEQKYCPIYPERVINPNSKTVEYKGKTIYLWSSSAARRWTRDADRYYQEAVEAGILK